MSPSSAVPTPLPPRGDGCWAFALATTAACVVLWVCVPPPGTRRGQLCRSAQPSPKGQRQPLGRIRLSRKINSRGLLPCVSVVPPLPRCSQRLVKPQRSTGCPKAGCDLPSGHPRDTATLPAPCCCPQLAAGGSSPPLLHAAFPGTSLAGTGRRARASLGWPPARSRSEMQPLHPPQPSVGA